MTPLDKPRSSKGLMGMTRTACLAMAIIGISTMAGCAAVVDHSTPPTPTGSDISSSSCMRMLKANWSIALAPTQNSECQSKFPEATIYRDEEANLSATQQADASNDSQSGMFTPFWVIF